MPTSTLLSWLRGLAVVCAIVLLAGCGDSAAERDIFESPDPDSGRARIEGEIKAAAAAAAAAPGDPAPLAELALWHYRAASVDGIDSAGAFTERGKARLRQAAQAWEAHLALDPEQPSARVAKLMTSAYGVEALNEPDKAVAAMAIVVDAENAPTANLYVQYAALAYGAGQKRTGDLARDRALELSDARDRKALRATLEQVRSASPAGAGE